MERLPRGEDRVDGEISLFLGGDVMLGRGIDQILPYPGDPTLTEPSVRDARDYIRLAERVHGPVARPVDSHVAVGRRPRGPGRGGAGRADHQPGDQRHHERRRRSGQVGALPDAPGQPAGAGGGCGRAPACWPTTTSATSASAGLVETLDVLARAGLPAVGAGRDAAEAARPAVLPVGDGRRVLVFAVGTVSSGIPPALGRHGGSAGGRAHRAHGRRGRGLIAAVRRVRGPRRPSSSDPLGSELGRRRAAPARRFAHRLIDSGVDVVTGTPRTIPGRSSCTAAG